MRSRIDAVADHRQRNNTAAFGALHAKIDIAPLDECARLNHYPFIAAAAFAVFARHIVLEPDFIGIAEISDREFGQYIVAITTLDTNSRSPFFVPGKQLDFAACLSLLVMGGD